MTSAGISPVHRFWRDAGASVRVTTTGASPSRRKLTVTLADCDEALASSRYVSKKPCEPSAKYHFVPGASTALPPCPPYAVASQIIVRSTISGRPEVEVTTVDTAVSSTPGTSSTRIVRCDFAASVSVCRTGGRPSGSRNWTVTGASASLGFAMATSRSKKRPVAPSAR